MNLLDIFTENEKIGGMPADKFDAAMARLKQRASQGPLKTVWDPVKRVYKNVPVNPPKPDVAEGFFGLSPSEKGKVQYHAHEVSDVPGNWDHKNQTFTDKGWDEMHQALGGSKKHMAYAKKTYSPVKEQGVAEGYNGEYDDEAGMSHTNLHTITRDAQNLLDTIDSHENLPEWVQEKIVKAQAMLSAAWDYLKSQEEQGIDPRVSTNENITVDARVTEPGTIVHNHMTGVGEVLGSDGRNVRVRNWQGRENRLTPTAVKFVANRETQPTLFTWKGRPQAGVLDRLNQRFQEREQALAEQQLAELSFLGSECTKDCSGHRAGYEWSHRKGLRQGNSPYSPSFNKGAALAVAGR
jgi:hypothetical protein